MKLDVQRRIAASLLGCSSKRVTFDPARLNDIKEAITKSDMRLLIEDGLVFAKPVRGVSRGRAKVLRQQKRKGLRRGHGSRRGTANAGADGKLAWIRSIRGQREFIAELKEKGLVSPETYRSLYRKSKGGMFRSRRHLKLYLDDQRLWQKKEELKK